MKTKANMQMTESVKSVQKAEAGRRIKTAIERLYGQQHC